jgi:hypothetical protein
VFAFWIKKLQLGFVCDDGSLGFANLSLDGGRPELKIVGTKRTVRNAGDCRFFGARGGIFAYGDAVLSFHSPENVVSSGGLRFEDPIISENRINLTASSLAVLTHDPRTLKLTRSAGISGKIVCLCQSLNFNITAMGCDYGRLLLRSGKTSAKVATLILDGEIPTHELVTQAWGFIVVKTEHCRFVFNVNGMFIAKAENCDRIMIWTTYRSHDMFDFVVYQNAEGRLSTFEAVFPLKLSHFDGYMKRIYAMTFHLSSETLIAVGEDGELIFVSRSQM